MKEYQLVLKLAAYLLEYPDENWQNDFAEYREVANQINTPQVKEVFTDLFAYVEKIGVKEYETQYVQSFDFSQNTNLYLTTHERTDFGKQAQELHEYKNLFLENGFDLNNELPDYLPAIFELATAVPSQNAKKILFKAKSKLELLRDRFIEAKLPHAFLMDAVLIQLENLNSEVT